MDALEAVYRLFPRLGELRRMQSSTLSGGQQQMVALGRALMTNRACCSATRYRSASRRRLSATSTGTSTPFAKAAFPIVIIEQNVAQACNASQHVYCLLEGRISLEGDPRKLAMDDITAAYFGTEQHA